MKTRRNRPIELTDAPVLRAIPIERVELRNDDSDEDCFYLEGYASTFEPYEMYGGPATGGWIEQLDRRAFDRTLKEKPDLHLLINHDGMPLARTKSGTLELSVDDHGLKVRAKLDRKDPDATRLERKMIRGDMDEMSFAFRVKNQKWEATDEFKDDPQALRTITEVSLHKGDVSVVNFGANPTTHAEVKSAADALRYLAECDESELVEARADGDILRRAQEKLGVGSVVNITNISEAIQNAGKAGAEAAERNIAYAGQTAGAAVAGVLGALGNVPEDVDTLRWLHAELSWRADVREWLDAEIREWLTAEEAYTNSKPKGISLRYALALTED